jgi:16S rRNA (cytosine967-C5)-methyltransferase
LSDPATPARRAAFEVLRRVFEHDAWADRAFPAAAEHYGLEGRDRAQAQRLAFGAVKRRGTTDHFAAELTGKKIERLDPPVIAALRLGLFDVCFSETADHAAVDAAVELAKGGMRRGGARRAAGAGGLVNAVLRRAASERTELLASLSDESPAEAAVAHSVPVWLAEMWWQELGADSARSLLGALNEPAETAMRVNTLRADPQELRAELEAAGEPLEGSDPGSDPRQGRRDSRHALRASRETLVWDGPLGEAALAALADGRMFAQSRGAQTVIETLAPEPGERVLDLCAGPGVKTVAIAARLQAKGEVVAVEKDPGRARQIEELAERAGASNVRVVVADAADGGDWSDFDRVLVDPPCSDLGTLASRPDARWRKDPGTIERLALLQQRILDTGIAAVTPGGQLVYSTCTISVRENERVIEATLAAHPDLVATEPVRTRPDLDGTDGFFIQELRKADNVGDSA